MLSIQEYVVSANTSLVESIQKLSENKYKGLVVEENARVIGVFTRQDMVNSLQYFGITSIKVKEVCNTSFSYCRNHIDKKIIAENQHSITPIINDDDELLDIYFLKPQGKEKKYHYPVVVMAGGLGTRLYPYTKEMPKPLVPVNGMPMIEIIMDRFHSYGTNDFHLVVNHKKEMIMDYFEGFEHDYKVFYGTESEKLDTGGGLYLVKDQIHDSFFLTNCDSLLTENYNEIYEYHKKSGNKVTMVAAVKIINIPYGVVNVNKDNEIMGMDEKPSYAMLVNIGVYVVERDVIDSIAANEKIGFPDVIKRLKKNGEKVGVYPITEDKWIDMGQVEEYKKACNTLKNYM